MCSSDLQRRPPLLSSSRSSLAARILCLDRNPTPGVGAQPRHRAPLPHRPPHLLPGSAPPSLPHSSSSADHPPPSPLTSSAEVSSSPTSSTDLPSPLPCVLLPSPSSNLCSHGSDRQCSRPTQERRRYLTANPSLCRLVKTVLELFYGPAPEMRVRLAGLQGRRQINYSGRPGCGFRYICVQREGPRGGAACRRRGGSRRGVAKSLPISPLDACPLAEDRKKVRSCSVF